MDKYINVKIISTNQRFIIVCIQFYFINSVFSIKQISMYVNMNSCI